MSASKVKFSFDGGLINFTIDGDIARSIIKNEGLISASGGEVYLSAKGKDSVIDNAVGGKIRGRKLVIRGGKVINAGIIEAKEIEGEKEEEKFATETQSTQREEKEEEFNAKSAENTENIEEENKELITDKLTAENSQSNSPINPSTHLPILTSSHTPIIKIISETDIISVGKLLAPEGEIILEASGHVESTGTLKTKKLTEKGASCEMSGTTIVENANYENDDGAVDISGNISGTHSDIDDVRLTGNITLIGNTVLNSDSDGSNNGVINMQSFDIFGGGFNLTLTAGENVTLNDITNINVFEISSSTTTDYTYTCAGVNSFSVNTFKTNYHAEFSRNVTSGTYHMIYDITQLQAMEDNLAWDYRLANNIDASATVSWNGGDGFDPVGNLGSEYTGSFDGAGFIVSNLTINRAELHIGLLVVLMEVIFQIWE